MNKADESPLKGIRKKRNLTLRDLYFKVKQEIKITRLSDINIARDCIKADEILILDKYLKLTDDEKEDLYNIDHYLTESKQRNRRSL